MFLDHHTCHLWLKRDPAVKYQSYLTFFDIIFLPDMHLSSKMSWKCYRQFSITKVKLQGKCANSRFNHKERQVLLTVQKLFGHYFLAKLIKVLQKTESVWTRFIYNVKDRYAIRLKFGDKFLWILTGQKYSQIKLQRLQKVGNGHLGRWHIKSTLYKRFLNWNKTF